MAFERWSTGAIQLTIRDKLGLGIAAILAPFLGSAPVIYYETERIREVASKMSLVDGPASIAVHEMEVDLAETGLALKAYLRDPIPDALERLRDGEQAFWRSYETYPG